VQRLEVHFKQLVGQARHFKFEKYALVPHVQVDPTKNCSPEQIVLIQFKPDDPKAYP
jgi:hypothetical protein